MAHYEFWNDVRKLFSDRLQELDLTTKELADMTGISNQTIKNFLSGKTKMMKLETQTPIIHILNIEKEHNRLMVRHFAGIDV